MKFLKHSNSKRCHTSISSSSRMYVFLYEFQMRIFTIKTSSKSSYNRDETKEKKKKGVEIKTQIKSRIDPSSKGLPKIQLSFNKKL